MRIVLLLALVLVVPAVEAAPGTLAAVRPARVDLDGSVHVAARNAAFVAEGAAPVALELEDAVGRATRFIDRGAIIPSAGGGTEWTWRRETQAMDAAGARIRILRQEPTFQVVATAWGAVSQAAVASAWQALGEERRTVRALDDASRAMVEAWGPFEHVVAPGAWNLTGPARRVALAAPLHADLAGAEVLWEGAGGQAVVRTYVHVEQRPGSIFNPLDGTWTGPGTHQEVVREALALDLTAGNLVAAGQGDLYAAAFDAGIAGTATLPAATGHATVDGDVHRFEAQDVLVTGRFLLKSAEGSFLLEGDIVGLSYGASRSSYPWTVPAAVGTGAVLAAILAWALAKGKLALWLAGYARVHGPEVLSSPHRARLHALVAAQPGSNVAALARQAGMGATSTTHHLRVLERNGLVASVRQGRDLLWFDRHDPRFAGPRRQAAAVLRGTTAGIARHVAQHPGIRQHEVAAAFGLSQPTVAWHMRRLREAGLVSQRKEGREMRYHAVGSWQGESVSDPPDRVAASL